MFDRKEDNMSFESEISIDDELQNEKKINMKRSAMTAGLVVLSFALMIEIIVFILLKINEKTPFLNELSALYGADMIKWIFNDTVQLLAFVISAFLISRFFYFKTLSLFKNKPVKLRENLYIAPVGLGFGFIAVLLTNIIINLVEKKGVLIPTGNITISDKSLPTLIVSGFAICIFAPVFEEFIFRGCLLNILKPFGSWLSIIFSALCFSLLHGNVGQGVGTFVFGIFLGIAALKTRSVYLSIAMHILNNAIAFVSMMLSSFYKESPLVGLLGVLIIAIVFYAVIMFTLRLERLKFKEVSDVKRIKRIIYLFLSPAVILYCLYCLYAILSGIVITTS